MSKNRRPEIRFVLASVSNGHSALFLSVSNLVDLGLQVRDDLPRDLVAEQLEQVDALITGDGLDGRHLDALLDALDGGIARDQLLRLGLSDGLVREGGPVPFLGGGHGHRNEGEQTDGYFHFRASLEDQEMVRIEMLLDGEALQCDFCPVL